MMSELVFVLFLFMFFYLVACWCRSGRQNRKPHRWPDGGDPLTGRCEPLEPTDHLDDERADDADDGRNDDATPKSTALI